MKRPRLFLAHAKEDKPLVRELYARLKAQGLDPWLDEEDLLPGQNWDMEIQNAIKKCDYFIACLSEQAIRKEGYVQKEFRMALDNCAEKPPGIIYLIPLKFDDCEVPSIKVPRMGVDLRDYQWLDYWKPDGFERLLKSIGITERETNTVDIEPSGWVNSLDMEFVYIKPGTFMMGSPESEVDRDDDENQHQVTLAQGFYLGKTTVTVGQFRKFIAATDYKIGEGVNGRKWSNPGFDQTDDHPVSCVSWNDAQAFIKWLGSKDDRQYCLPTEAEWEYAARAGTTTPFSFGDTLGTDQANYDGNYPYGKGFKGIYRKKTTPVRNFAPNAWGLYDMHGNVWEWCQDWYGKYPKSNVTDQRGPSSGPDRVIRGGSWFNPAWFCRAAYRSRFEPSDRNFILGFRLALLPGQPS